MIYKNNFTQKFYKIKLILVLLLRFDIINLYYRKLLVKFN